MSTRHFAVLGLIGTVLAAAVGGAAVGAAAATLSTLPPEPTAVPPQYSALYAQVQAQVGAFSAGTGTAPTNATTRFGTELLAADGNIGAGLLSPDALVGVETELDAYAAMGIQGVTVDVSFPLLVPTTPHHAGYLRFYEEVARQIRLRHLVFSVEENPVFSGTPLTSLRISYAGLDLSSYATEARAQAQTIIDHLRPDYLSLMSEPDTDTDTLGINLDTPSAAVRVMRAELSGLRRRATAVGAGTGTWSSPSIDRALLADTTIDYLDVHVYPLSPQFVANLDTDVALARSAHKPLVMDETWLNKPTAGEGTGPAGAPESLKVKSYSFWQPLDEEFVSAMVRDARAAGFAYVSFFDGARAFFGYLTWTPQLQAASYRAFTEEYDAEVGHNMRSLSLSGTGVAMVEALAAR